MDNELISKKELLELTGISYGQLYRWKRKRLLPEEWFIKKSSFTGQETFFPRDKILDRLGKIQNMKDDLSLDDIARMFSPELEDILLNKEELIGGNIVTQIALDTFLKHQGECDLYSFEKILHIAVLDKFLQKGTVSIEESGIIIECLEANSKMFTEKQFEMVFIRKLGVAVCLVIMVPNEFYVDGSARVVERVSISKCIEELKLILK